jgi:hypothetical protein
MAHLLQPSLNAAEEELFWQFSAYDNQSVKYGIEVNTDIEKTSVGTLSMSYGL